MAEYFVYLSYPDSRAVIHLATCPDCKPHNGTPTDYWSGPYNNVEKAKGYAFVALKKNISGCPKCTNIGKVINPLPMDSFD
ncbi:MAG: hypothetical protein HZA77_04975 [Candidatus Schekmanbacteria bacterium]|nr:hypothetical protein [Candidatus Schekmanbacteria bacterium]